MTLCKDCKHVQVIQRVGPFGSSLFVCNAPQNEVGVDPVNGIKLYRAHRCDDQRDTRLLLFFRSKFCGPEANWFEVAK